MKDLIYRQDAIDALEEVDWYHQNKDKDMVLGANPPEHQAWYKEDDIFKTLEALPSAQPEKMQLSREDATFDCISRQAAIDALKNRWKKTRNYEGIGDDIAEECELYLKQVPSAQPEIIFCKDCANWDTTWTNDWSPNYHYCPIIDGVRKDDFYCADAERRTDGRD